MLARLIPGLRGPMSRLRKDSWFPIRFPAALFLICGGLLGFLPVLGFWMVPLGLLLLAIDMPVLRGPISVLIIRVRRSGTRWIRRWQAWWRKS